jgi:hypothetical protein
MSAWPKPEAIRKLIGIVKVGAEIDRLTEAHLTAALVAPAGAFVTMASFTKEIRVCVGRKPATHRDYVWPDWPAWQLRRAAGTLDAAFGVVERNLPGVSFLYARGRMRADEPPYACQLLFGAGEVLGEAEHVDGPSAVILALLNALLAAQENGDRMRQAAGGRA